MVKIAILGFGTVGSGVGDVLVFSADQLRENLGKQVKLKYILSRSPVKDKRFSEYQINDFSVIENDPEVEVVVEAIGGTGAALEYTKRALLAGKNVVTANKEIVAVHGTELLMLAKEKNVNYLFEASVGGGIPILRPINQCLAANEINEIYGILNGTTNYILTEMYNRGISMEEALKQAQELGYAEQDPSADVDGMDVCWKICILANLAFGKAVNPDLIHTEGIRNIKKEDIAYSVNKGYKIKLLGRTLHKSKKEILIYVSPHLVKEDNMLAAVNDVFNGIVVKGNAIGDAMFYGRGAGKLPTASAVLADVVDAAKHTKARKDISWGSAPENYIGDKDLVESKWCIRAGLNEADKLGQLGEVSVIGEYAYVISGSMNRYEIDKALKAIKTSNIIRVIE